MQLPLRMFQLFKIGMNTHIVQHAEHIECLLFVLDPIHHFYASYEFVIFILFPFI